MSDTLLIHSCVDVHGPMTEALKWLEPIHTAYAKKWDMDTMFNYDQIIDPEADPGDGEQYNPAWDRIKIIRDMLAEGTHYEYLIWVDHDVLIANFSVDLRTAFEDGKDLMMCVHPGVPQVDHSLYPPHFNAGVMGIRNTPRTTEFFDLVWQRRYKGPPWFEQDVINSLLRDWKWMDMIGVMEDRFNSTPNANEVPKDEIVIAAFHGVGSWHDVEGRLHVMKQAFDILNVEEQMK